MPASCSSSKILFSCLCYFIILQFLKSVTSNKALTLLHHMSKCLFEIPIYCTWVRVISCFFLLSKRMYLRPQLAQIEIAKRYSAVKCVLPSSSMSRHEKQHACVHFLSLHSAPTPLPQQLTPALHTAWAPFSRCFSLLNNTLNSHSPGGARRALGKTQTSWNLGSPLRFEPCPLSDFCLFVCLRGGLRYTDLAVFLWIKYTLSLGW